MNYEAFLQSKMKSSPASGFDPGVLTECLFDYQEAVTRWAIRRGRAAIWAGTGLGKTAMQLEFGHRVTEKTKGRALLLAPIAVGKQTANEARKMRIPLHSIDITNYEQLHNVDPLKYVCVIGDELSIIKSFSGAIRNQMIEMFRDVPYRLSCTATPAPNDYMELGNQAEFLGICSRAEMLAEFFIHDGGETSKWRLKGHAQSRFWEWLASWAMVFSSPADIGFDGSRHKLPALRYHERIVPTEYLPDGELFADHAVDIRGRIIARRETIAERCDEAIKLANELDGQILVWCDMNEESRRLAAGINGAVEVTGSDSVEHKEKTMLDFSAGKVRVLVSKSVICGYGMNWQNSHQSIYVGLSDSWERFYQSIRRQWRFGQKHAVDAYLVISEREGSVKRNIERKEIQALEMQREMIKHMESAMKKEIGIITEKVQAKYESSSVTVGRSKLYHGDSCEIIKDIPDESIDFSCFSPPFSSLYTYSNSERDIGNCRNDSEFMDHYRFLAQEQFRIHRPGRVMAVHCMDLPAMKERDGYIGVKDFPGALIGLYEEIGFTYDGRITIWKNPVTAMQRTKSIRLLHKQIKKDSAMSGVGLPDYILKFKKPGENQDAVSHTAEEFPVSKWQQYASPVWMDINPSDTLQYMQARENDDERHIAPLQLEVIRRCSELWSKAGDVCFTPFMGIGSECFVWLEMNRQAIGIELKKSYYEAAIRNAREAASSVDLFCGAV